MEYLKLVLGILLIFAFSWILMRNAKRSGFMHGLFRVDTILGMIAGLYLVVTAVQALLIQ